MFIYGFCGTVLRIGRLFQFMMRTSCLFLYPYTNIRFDITGKKSTGKGKEKEQASEEIIRTYTWGRILIIAGYSEQKRLLEQTLSELPER